MPERGEAESLALLLSGIDSEAKRNMRVFLNKGIRVSDFMPYLRREVARMLDEKDGPELKPTVRARLNEWVVRWGKGSRSGEYYTLHVDASFSLRQLQDLNVHVEKAGIPRSEFIRNAVMREIARLEGGSEG
jgi:hypothetical protein